MACPCLQESTKHQTIEWVHVQDGEEIKTIMDKEGEVAAVHAIPAPTAALQPDDGRVLRAQRVLVLRQSDAGYGSARRRSVSRRGKSERPHPHRAPPPKRRASVGVPAARRPAAPHGPPARRVPPAAPAPQPAPAVPQPGPPARHVPAAPPPPPEPLPAASATLAWLNAQPSRQQGQPRHLRSYEAMMNLFRESEAQAPMVSPIERHVPRPDVDPEDWEVLTMEAQNL